MLLGYLDRYLPPIGTLIDIYMRHPTCKVINSPAITGQRSWVGINTPSCASSSSILRISGTLMASYLGLAHITEHQGYRASPGP